MRKKIYMYKCHISEMRKILENELLYGDWPVWAFASKKNLKKFDADYARNCGCYRDKSDTNLCKHKIVGVKFILKEQ